MVAVLMSEVLEPEGLGHDLLVEWAPWVADDDEGRASWSVKPRVDRGYHGDMPRRIVLVEKIVARHKLQDRTYWRVVVRYYIRGRAMWEIARELGEGWSESRVLTTLVTFCGLVEREYRDATGI